MRIIAKNKKNDKNENGSISEDGNESGNEGEYSCNYTVVCVSIQL